MSKKRLAPTVTSPAKMGEEMARPRATESQSPNVKNIAKTSASKSGAPVGTLSGPRRNIQERLGAKFAPQMVMSAPQAPESAQTGRNVRLLPSAVGRSGSEFWSKRQYGQVQQ